MSTIRIQTTQNVSLEYEIASVGDRIVASIIDYGLYFVWFIAWSVLNGQYHLSPGGRAGQVIPLLPTTFYMLACEVFLNGQTLGKKALSLRVVRMDGTRAGLGDYLLRWLLRPIEIVATSGVVALVAILLNGRGQRLGDLAAGTTVISLKKRSGYATPLAAEVTAIAGYQPVFAQAAALSDHDVALIRKLLHHGSKQENYLLLNEVANKVKSITGIQTTLQDAPFLKTILRDHAHLAVHG
ncbi:RDD family protein [Hymenobacter artigasi]|uniref:RDD family membrane protein YckC n=1 Tax=Hymenobacter artigasi TaxID=2719616 RepID=A0ABX1HMN1_9BACT|nr:RDD family protein [Hymenobacter artigasi]NKI91513.1 putative RDD family membrane protein YckC [Hymenobacter artigasi]